MGLPAEVWKRLKSLAVVHRPVKKDVSGLHPGSVRGDKININRPKIGKGKRFSTHTPTQHERVVAGRAKRMGISVQEYKQRFC